jgi:hypothetical protein
MRPQDISRKGAKTQRNFQTRATSLILSGVQPSFTHSNISALLHSPPNFISDNSTRTSPFIFKTTFSTTSPPASSSITKPSCHTTPNGNFGATLTNKTSRLLLCKTTTTQAQRLVFDQFHQTSLPLCVLALNLLPSLLGTRSDESEHYEPSIIRDNLASINGQLAVSANPSASASELRQHRPRHLVFEQMRATAMRTTRLLRVA